jgi:hypothetical protein
VQGLHAVPCKDQKAGTDSTGAMQTRQCTGAPLLVHVSVSATSIIGFCTSVLTVSYQSQVHACM